MIMKKGLRINIIIALMVLILTGSCAATAEIRIGDYEVYVEGERQKGISELDTIHNVKPGSNLTISILVENLAPKYRRDEIEDIYVTASIEDIDYDYDLEIELPRFSLTEDEERIVEMHIPIPYKVYEGTYPMVIRAEGEDDDGNEISDEAEFHIEVDKNKHEVKFKQCSLSAASVQRDSNVNLMMHLIDTGSKDEDVALQISNDDLGIKILKATSMDRDPDAHNNEYTDTFSLHIPKDAECNTYTLTIDLGYSMESERRTLPLAVIGCEEEVDDAPLEGADEESGLDDIASTNQSWVILDDLTTQAEAEDHTHEEDEDAVAPDMTGMSIVSINPKEQSSQAHTRVERPDNQAQIKGTSGIFSGKILLVIMVIPWLGLVIFIGRILKRR